MRVAELIEANQRLEARVAELEQRLNRSSRSSSLPPSQDPPSAPPRSRQAGSGRTRGGQPGHEGKHRPLLPLERVDHVVEHWPARCQACAQVFGEAERLDSAPPQRHQVSELPPIAVAVTEHRLHRLRCPTCAAETRAELPAGVPRWYFGPDLQAAVATLAIRNRVSRRDAVELMDELFGVELATGSIDAIVERADDALAEPYAGLRDQIRSASAVNMDETGWRTAGKRRTLWGALTERRAGRTQEHQDEVPAPLRHQPAQALAGPVDLRPHRRRRADEQPCRARPPRGRHLPQALPRQPVRARRTHDRTPALGVGYVPSARTLALRLPQRRPHRQHPRRPNPDPRLIDRGWGVNAYSLGLSARDASKHAPLLPRDADLYAVKAGATGVEPPKTPTEIRE
jgi:hypothetical protein